MEGKTTVQQGSNERPYRSHLRPACLSCRKRKSRCQSDASSETCLMCRAHGSDCVFPTNTAAGVNRTPETRRRRQTRLGSTPRRRQLVSGSVSDSPQTQPSLNFDTRAVPVQLQGPAITATGNSGVPQIPSVQWTAPAPAVHEDESPLALVSNDDQQHNLHIVGPAATSDNQVLSDYLSAMPGATRGSSMVTVAPGNPSRPVLFTMVEKVPLGLAASRSPSAEKVEIIEKILEPFGPDVIDVYVSRCLIYRIANIYQLL